MERILSSESERAGRFMSDRGFLDAIGPRFLWLVVPLFLLAASHTVSLRRLPEIDCLFLKVTGYPCPFCGTTRSFWLMAAGEVSHAFRNSPFGASLYPVAWLVVIYNMSFICLKASGKGKPGNFFKASNYVVFAGIFLILNWFYRLIAGLK